MTTPLELVMEAHARAIAGELAPERLHELPAATGVRERYYPFLYHLAVLLQPARIVEVGVCQGVSLAHLAAGAPPTCQVMGVDNNPTQILDIAMVKHLVAYGDSILDAQKFATQYGGGLPIDLLFLDASKQPAEWPAWRPYCSDNVVVCVDDRIAQQSELWASVKTPAKIELDDLHAVPFGEHEHTGFGVFIGRDDAPAH